MKTCCVCNGILKPYQKSNVSLENTDSYAYASRKIPEYMHWDLYECEDCKILYSDCPTNVEDIYDKYENAAYDSSEEADYASETYIKYLKKHLPSFPNGKALDIGTGNGSYLLALKKEGIENVMGVEPSREPIAQANPSVRGNIINAPFEKGMFAENEFEMVSLFQTIEHIPDSISVLEEIRRNLKPNGVFYLVCHNYRSLVNAIMGFKSPIYDIEHLQIFSQKGIRKLMEKAGFRNIEVFTIKNRYPLRYWFRLFPAPQRIKKRMMPRLDKSKLGRMMLGVNVGNIGVICRK